MISLVIPVLSEASCLRANLPRWQSVRGVAELVVVDGGSTDDSVAVAQRHGVRVVSSKPGRGPQLNAGARATDAPYLVFLHADAWLDEDALEEVPSLLGDSSVAAGVFRQHIEGPRRVYRCIERVASWRARWLRRPYGDSGLFLRREVFDTVGGYPDVPLCEDLGMARKLRRIGRVALAQSHVHLSARRWEERGFVRTTLLNWGVATSFRLGVPPARLYRAYYGKTS